MSGTPQCKCPCGGNRGYPPAYRVGWTGFAITSDKILSHVGDGTYWQLVLGDAVEVQDGICAGPVDIPYTAIHYDTDGTTVLGSEDATIHVEITASSFTFDCPGADDCHNSLAFTLSAILSNNPGGFAVGDIQPVAKLNLGGTPDVSFNRCSGKTSDGATSATCLFDVSPFVTNPGLLTVTPKCRDCNGNRLDATGTRGTQCSPEYDVTATFDDSIDGSDPISALHVWQLFGSAAGGWVGVDQFGNLGIVSTASSNPADDSQKCCPNDDPDKCGLRLRQFGVPWLLDHDASNGRR